MNPSKLARNIMVTKVTTLSPRQHVLNGIARLLRQKISGAPVVDAEGRYVGVFSEKCCMRVLKATATLASRQKQSLRQPLARQFMTTRLTTLRPNMEVFEAVGLLLRHRISGAPVLDESGNYLGIFSEKGSMRALIDAAYEQLPARPVSAFVDDDPQRTIGEDLDLLSVAQIFLDTPYRRLPVLHEGRLVGQVSRRDVLRAQHHLSKYLADPDQALAEFSQSIDSEEATAGDVQARAQEQSPGDEGFLIQGFMDTKALSTSPDADLLSLAEIFLDTPYRRLPVVSGDKLNGQVSRRDVLSATYDLMAIAPPAEYNLLYLSALVDRTDAPPLG